MSKSAVKDLTVGSPSKLILSFLIPMACGMLFQQFYSVADAVIVGRFLGVDALAAVGSTGSINFMIVGFCIGICSGFAIPVAQKFGEKNFTELRKCVANSAWLAIAFATVITLIVCIFCWDILEWMNTPKDIIGRAYQYIFIIFLGIPATFLYNMASGIIRSLGDSKTPLYFLVFSSILNIVLDIVAILGLNLGVAGAGYATVLSQAIAGVICFFYMKKKYSILKMSKEELKPDRSIIMNLCGMGIPMGLQYTITAIGCVILQAFTNELGSMAVGAITAGNKVYMFFACVLDAMGGTMATYGGQNMGARKLERIQSGLRAMITIGVIYSLLSLVILYFYSDIFAMMFIDVDEINLLGQVRQYILTNATFFIPLALVNILRFLIQGLGFSKVAIFAGVAEMVARALAGICLVSVYGYVGACFANPLAWLAADAFLIPCYFYAMKTTKKQWELEGNA